MLYLRYENEVDAEHQLPLGLLYVTRALKDKGFKVEFLDYQFCLSDDPFSIDTTLEFVGSDPAPVIGLSCMFNLLPFTILVAQALKQQFPDRVIVIGGVGTTHIEEKLLERFEWLDIIVRGEGECTAPELLAAILNNTDLSVVKGISYRDKTGIRRTPDRARIKDLDSIPFSALEEVNLNDYPAFGIMASRGCPYPCTFCSVAPAWNRFSNYRSVKNVIEEIKFLKEKTGTDVFLFQDEFFISTKPRMMAFCKALQDANLDISWKCFGHVNLVDDEMMYMMRESGCTDLRFGIESGSSRILKLLKKGFGQEKAADVISRATRIFQTVDTFFIWGFPFETLQDFRETLLQMIAFRLLGARILPSLLSILPATEIYQNLSHHEKESMQLCPYLVPEMVLTGHEQINGGKVTIAEKHQLFFNLIRDNKDLFPGFYVLNLEDSILPKLELLREHDFYHDELESAKGVPSRQLAQFRAN